jgi:hypothetical protein
MQQVLDAIAVGASEEIFARRIVPQQSSSIPGRGQIYGMNMIKGWALKDARAQRYAKKHQIRYTPKTKYWAKADITKCYQSLRVPVFMRLFERDCANKDLVWLWQALLESHIQDGQKGFMIGSLVSQYAAQYIFSFAYRYITSLTFTRRGKRLRKVEHCLFYMDDILMTGRSKNQLASAVKSLTRYCKEEFGITVKPSWMIYRTDVTPMDMMGFRIHSNGKVTLRATIHKRQRRSYLRCRNRSPALSQCRRLMSFRGWIKHSNLTGYKSKTVLKVKSLCNQIISKEAINANRAHNRARAGVVHATA